jgi:flagellar biogenesis protein FliO
VAQLFSLGGSRITHKPTPNQIMQPQIMATLGTFFFFIYLACVLAVIIYVLRLLGRFVSAHERVASSLDIIARKMKDDAKP